MSELPQNPRLPQRARPVHPPVREESKRSAIIFLTVCTKDRRPLLAVEDCHKAILAAWSAAAHWTVGRYVIMPDHLHLFCSPAISPPAALASWVRHWKAAVSKSQHAPAGTFWQTDFWDTQLRHQDSYQAKWEYVRNNPVRAGLVTHAGEWPFQGNVSDLRWHD